MREAYSKEFRHDKGTGETEGFGSFFWEEVKEGHIRDQIYAFGRGVGKGVWAGAKGTVEFAHTLVTNPNANTNTQ